MHQVVENMGPAPLRAAYNLKCHIVYPLNYGFKLVLLNSISSTFIP